MAENFGGCFYVVARLVPKPIQRFYGQYFGESLDKINPARAKLTYVNVIKSGRFIKSDFSKYQKDNIDQELVVAIRGEILPDGKWK